MKNILIKTTALFCATFLLVSFIDMALPNGEDALYAGVTRLHILANSDSEYDQGIKLLVRDAVIEAGSTDKNTILDVANGVLLREGAPYRATAVYGDEDYDTRVYDGIAFPCGNYHSLRIMLGDGEGKNWWCVLFPPLCLSAATAKESLNEVGIDDRAYGVYTERKYVIRFKLLELFKNRR